jgi:hypothetical protein
MSSTIPAQAEHRLRAGWEEAGTAWDGPSASDVRLSARIPPSDGRPADLKAARRRTDLRAMPRLALLIAAFALLLGAAAAQAAPVPAVAPTAHAAQDDAGFDDEACAPEEDACLDEEWDDDEAWDEQLACEDDWADDEDWLDEDEALAGDEEAIADAETSAESATDDACADEETVVAPDLTALTTAVAGEGRRLRVTVGFRLDQPGRVELTLARVGAAASKRAACPRGARAAAAKRADRACPRTLPGKVTVVGRAGANAHELRGTWRGKRLSPGSYRLTATPKASGATSDTATFKVAAT